MEFDLVALIAGKSEENRTYREQLTRQLEVLGKGAEICKYFAVVKFSGKITGTEQPDDCLLYLADDRVVTEEEANNSSDEMGDIEDIAPYCENIALQASETIAYEKDLEEKTNPLELVCKPVPEVVY
jgi:hypothetical protein